VTLHEALSGQPLYERPTPMATMAAIVLEPEAPSVRALRPEVPEALDRIVRKGLAKKADERYATAAELRADLERVARALSPAGHAGQAKETTLARYLAALFPGESKREPVLDRKPPSVRFVPTAAKTEPTPLDLQLAAEAELEGDAMLRDQRARARIIALLVALVVIGTLAFVIVNLR
jgi:serine/threonine-protein kinase